MQLNTLNNITQTLCSQIDFDGKYKFLDYIMTKYSFSSNEIELK